MAGFVLGLYPDFSCLADRCPATCCTGWKIIVDQEAYQRFLRMDDTKLRKDILENLVEENGTYRFVNRPSGACAMLDSDGLCRIQRNTREEMLCNTCRKFPRIIGRVSECIQNTNVIGVSFAASCPVVAEYILSGSVSWLWLEDNGQLYSLSHSQWETFQKTITMPPTGKAVTLSWELAELFDIFVDLSLDILDILVHFPEIPYLDQSFELYHAEEPDLTMFGRFFVETEDAWQAFVRQYQNYRYPSRYLEFQEEDRIERAKQIQGELLLMRIMLCSRYVLHGKCRHTDWMEILHWVYRFSAHGEVMAERVHAMIISWKNKYLELACSKICSM